MMWQSFCRVAFVAGCLFVTLTGAYGACIANEDDLKKLHPEEIEPIVRQEFSLSNYDCGILAVHTRATAVTAQSGSKRMDAQFGLRDLALRINLEPHFPPEKRLLLLQAAVIPTERLGVHRDDEETKFDALMFLKAAEQFRAQQDVDGSLEALALGIGTDQHLPAEKRVIKSWSFSLSVLDDSTKTYRFLGPMLLLANLTKGDEVLAGFRSQLAFHVYYSGVALHQGDLRIAVLERAKLLLQLADALSDVKECYMFGANWQWRPILRSGVAYYQLGETAQGSKEIRRAIQMARDIENPDYRLGQYRFVISELLMAKFDRSTTSSLAKEMLDLANTLDTPIAKEERKSLPNVIKTWGLDSPQ